MKRTKISIFTKVLAFLVCVVVLAGIMTACANGNKTDGGAGNLTGDVPVDTPVDTPDNPTDTPTDNPPVDNPPVDNPPVDNPPVDNPPVDNPPVDNPPVDNPPVDNPPVDNPPVEDPPVIVDPNEIYSASASISKDSLIYGALTGDVVIGMDEGVGAIVPADVQVVAGATSLALSVKTVDENNDVTIGETDTASSYDVHISGIASDNKVPMTINLGSIMATGLGDTEIKFYHIENGTPVLMTRVETTADFAIHNQYAYNPLTGEISIYVASFSVFTGVQTTPADKWDGTSVADGFASGTGTENDPYLINTAAQLVYFRNQVDAGVTYEGQYVALGADIDLEAYKYDAEGNPVLEDEVHVRVSFDPIGYGYVYSGGQAFMGTFDGQRHTIYNLYQNGWDLGYSYTTSGGGLFASILGTEASPVVIKNLAVSGANIVMECIDMGIVVGLAQGVCEFDNIIVTNSKIANYNRSTGAVVGEVTKGPYGTDINEGYSHTFKNITVDSTVKVSSLWGSFDTSCGGVIGGKWGDATVKMTNLNVAAELDVFSDVTAAYQWYAYRRCGMLIGHTEQNSPKSAINAEATFLTCENVNVYYGEWVNYKYYQFTNQDNSWQNNYPWVRAEAGEHNGAFSNARYGNPIVGGVAINSTELAEANKTAYTPIVFNQLYGGGQGVYGKADHTGVNTMYNSFKKTIYIHEPENLGWENLKLLYWCRNGNDTWTTVVEGIDLVRDEQLGGFIFKVQLPYTVDSFKVVADNNRETVEHFLTEVDENGHITIRCNHTGGTATCVAKAVCDRCGESYGEIAPNNHGAISEILSSDNGKHFNYCTNGCGERYNEANCTGGKATCVEPATCVTCGNYYGSVQAEEHKFDKYTADGDKHYQLCEYGCGAKQNEEDHVKADTYTTENGVHWKACTANCGYKYDKADCGGTATCQDEKGVQCPTCGVLHGGAGNHIYVAYTTEEVHGQRCKYCLEGEEGKYTAIAHTFEWKDKGATATSYGKLVQVCSCGYEIESDKVSVKTDVLAVKDDASGIVVIMHDDGSITSALTMDEIFAKYGLVGDVAMRVGADNGEYVLDTNTKTNYNDDRYNNGVIANWRDLFATGRWKVVSRSTAMQSWVGAAENSDLLKYEIAKSQQILRNLFPGQNVYTFAYPQFNEDKGNVGNTAANIFSQVYSAAARKMIAQYYLSARGTEFKTITVSGSQAYYEKQFSNLAYANESVWNFFPSFTLDDTNFDSAKIYISQAAKEGKILVIRMTGVDKTEDQIEANHIKASTLDNVAKFLSAYVQDGTIWNTHYEDAIIYLREAQTAKVYTEKVDGNTLKVTLTDGVSQFVLDENGNATTEQMYDMPLSVRISVPSELGWKAVKIEQGGKTSYAEIVNGSFVADIVPDADDAIITSATLNEVIADKEANSDAGNTTTTPATPSVEATDREYDFGDPADEKLIGSTITGGSKVENLGEKVNVKVEEGVLHAQKHYAVDVEEATNLNHHVIIPSGIGTISNPNALDISFKIRIDNPAIITDRNSGYDVLWRINFSNNSPITVFIGIDKYKISTSTLNEDGTPSNPIADGTLCMYIGDTYSGEDRELVLKAGVEYEITFKFRTLANDTHQLEIWVDDKCVDTTTAFNDVPYDFNHLDFTAQTRSYYDLYLDDVTFKSCSGNTHVFDGAWTTSKNAEGKMVHTNTCALCKAEIEELCDVQCDKVCSTCGYNDGEAGHTYGEWQKLEGANGVYVAYCEKCNHVISTSYTNTNSVKLDLVTAPKVADDVNKALQFYKTNKSNAEVIVNFDSYTSNKITFNFDVFVPMEATVAPRTDDIKDVHGVEVTNYPNTRMIQLYISDFFNPYIGVSKETTKVTGTGGTEVETYSINPNKWSFGHLTRENNKDNSHHFVELDREKWYSISIEMYMSQGKAIVYVKDVAENEVVGTYATTLCNTSIDTISNVRLYAQMRYNGGLDEYGDESGIRFDNLSLSASDISVDKTFDFENGTTDVNCDITKYGEGDKNGQAGGTLTAVPEDNNTYIELNRPAGLSTHFAFQLPSTEAEAEAILFSFKINVQNEGTVNNSELRIKFSSNDKTSYMATITKKSDGFVIGEKRSSSNINADAQDLKFENRENKFSLGTWYTITLKIHVTCCDEFLVEWIVTDENNNEWRAYSRNFAREHHDEIRPETAVTYVDFWSVGTQTYAYHCFLDDISIKAGGSVVLDDHTINNASTAPIYVSDGDGYHYKSYSCQNITVTDNNVTVNHAECDKIGYAECTYSNGTCTVCGYTPTRTASNGANR